MQQSKATCSHLPYIMASGLFNVTGGVGVVMDHITNRFINLSINCYFPRGGGEGSGKSS